MPRSKLVKSIEPIEGKPTLNVFGYSALILNQDILLKAVTNQTAAVYQLKRKDIQDCLLKNMTDC